MMVIVALATPAYAQLSPGGGSPGSSSPGSGAPSGAKPSLTVGGEKKAKTEEDLEYERQREGAYKAGLSKIPDKKANADPWGSIRGAATPQAKPSQQRPSSK
jgi:hypothetical protein